MRINPVTDWSYEQIWAFLKDFEIEYCGLYDLGYTHLGNKNNTVKNPYLKIEGDVYMEAYKANGKYENFSRLASESKIDWDSYEKILGIVKINSENVFQLTFVIELGVKPNKSHKLFDRNEFRFSNYSRLGRSDQSFTIKNGRC